MIGQAYEKDRNKAEEEADPETDTERHRKTRKARKDTKDTERHEGYGKHGKTRKIRKDSAGESRMIG